MCTRERIIAVDFDGCLCKNAWPDIGEAKQNVIDRLLLRQKQGAKIILWTCRVGERLDAAVKWCADHGIVFDTINENLPSMVATFGNDCRKVYADEYWDDKSVPIGVTLMQIYKGEGGFSMGDYFVRISIDKSEIDDILQELEQAKKTIYKCFSRLEEIGLVVTGKEENAASGN